MRISDWSSDVCSSDLIMDRYVERLLQDFDGAAFRIGLDAGNGAAGPVIEKLTKLLPGEHHLLFTEVDGNFPNHHPDPTEEKNLTDLKALVAEKKLDFGVAFDGDGDRIGARSEDHTSELQSLMRISYAVFCLKKKNKTTNCSTQEH